MPRFKDSDGIVLLILSMVASTFFACSYWDGLKAFGATVSASDSGIEALLRRSQEAVLKSGSLVSKDQDDRETPIVRPKHAKTRPPATPRIESPLIGISNHEEETKSLEPIDSKAIEKVISIDLLATQREQGPQYPVFNISLSGGVHFLRPGYDLMKDDDHFKDDLGGALKGFYLSFEPTWKISALENAVVRTFIAPVFQVGYSQGNFPMRRTGIHPSESAYDVALFPAEVGCQVEVEFWRSLSAILGYGPGLEIFHQAGAGVNDTISQVFYGDDVWLGLSLKISKSTQIFLSYKSKGTQLLIRSPSYGGQVLSMGINFGLLG